MNLTKYLKQLISNEISLSSLTKRDLKLFRIYIIFISVVYFLVGYAFKAIGPTIVEPMTDRALVSFIGVIFVILSYKSDFVKKYFLYAMYIFFLVLHTGVLYLNYLNGFSTAYLIGLYSSMFAIGYIFRSLFPFLIYATIETSIMFYLLHIIGDNLKTNVYFVVSIWLIIVLIDMAIQSVWNRTSSKLRIANKLLEKQKRELVKKNLMLKKLNLEMDTAKNRLKKQNVQLKQLDKEKDEFLSIAAHELKTPLTSIKGFTELMNKESTLKNRSKTRHYLNFVRQNTIRLNNLILDLVDSSRISLNKLNIKLTEVSPQTVFNDIKSNMKIVIAEKGITPVFKIEKNLPSIRADYERILQVIRNLIINATHFTPKGGKIIFRVFKDGKYVKFEIKDNGEGIPKSKQEKIFSRFYQVDSSITRKVNGSGLGLSICKGLVELMNGKIGFESVEGKGTTFYFIIPVY